MESILDMRLGASAFASSGMMPIADMAFADIFSVARAAAKVVASALLVVAAVMIYRLGGMHRREDDRARRAGAA
jgi:hypothetical protein